MTPLSCDTIAQRAPGGAGGDAPLSCDTMVAVPGATRDGQTIFAKNSDRPREECQPLVLHERQTHAPGTTVRTQFLELPQAPVTWRHVGSRPYWCWGYEHGFNEHQVAIGNEALQSRLPEYSEPKLVGMELIRLGLERGRTAAEAIEVMMGLIERYGQGRFANGAGVRAYDNGYIVADPNEAYVLETAGHEWAVKRVEGATGISNTRSLFDNYDRVSATAGPRAVEAGWWSGAGRLDFDEVYGPPRKPDGSPARVVLRGVRSCAVLGRAEGGIDVRAMMALLRDHSDGTRPDEAPPADVPDAPSICMHYGREVDGQVQGEVQGNTAASLVADLCADGSRLPVFWCSFYSPCLSVFFPVFIEAALPPELSVGSAEPSDDSPWWTFRALDRAVRRQNGGVVGGEAAALVRQTRQPLQEELLESAYRVAAQGRELIAAGRAEEASRLLTEYVAGNVRTVLETARGLRERLEAGSTTSRTTGREPVLVGAAG